MTYTYNKKIATVYPKNAILFSYFVMFLGLLLLTKGLFIVGLLVLLIASYFSFSFYGVAINKEKTLIKEYISPLGLGFKIGKEKNLQQFPYLTLISRNLSSKTYGMSSFSYTDRERVYDICLLNNNHRQKIVIKRLYSREKMHDEINYLVNLLDKKKVKYTPTLSEASKLKKRNRL